MDLMARPLDLFLNASVFRHDVDVTMFAFLNCPDCYKYTPSTATGETKDVGRVGEVRLVADMFPWLGLRDRRWLRLPQRRGSGKLAATSVSQAAPASVPEPEWIRRYARLDGTRTVSTGARQRVVVWSGGPLGVRFQHQLQQEGCFTRAMKETALYRMSRSHVLKLLSIAAERPADLAHHSENNPSLTNTSPCSVSVTIYACMPGHCDARFWACQSYSLRPAPGLH